MFFNFNSLCFKSVVLLTIQILYLFLLMVGNKFNLECIVKWDWPCTWYFKIFFKVVFSRTVKLFLWNATFQSYVFCWNINIRIFTFWWVILKRLCIIFIDFKTFQIIFGYSLTIFASNWLIIQFCYSFGKCSYWTCFTSYWSRLCHTLNINKTFTCLNSLKWLNNSKIIISNKCVYTFIYFC